MGIELYILSGCEESSRLMIRECVRVELVGGSLYI